MGKRRRSSSLFLNCNSGPQTGNALSVALSPQEALQGLASQPDRLLLAPPPGNGGAHDTWVVGESLEDMAMREAMRASLLEAQRGRDAAASQSQPEAALARQGSGEPAAEPIEVGRSSSEEDLGDAPHAPQGGDAMSGVLRRCLSDTGYEPAHFVDRRQAWGGKALSEAALVRLRAAMQLVMSELERRRGAAIAAGYQRSCEDLLGSLSKGRSVRLLVLAAQPYRWQQWLYPIAFVAPGSSRSIEVITSTLRQKAYPRQLAQASTGSEPPEAHFSWWCKLAEAGVLCFNRRAVNCDEAPLSEAEHAWIQAMASVAEAAGGVLVVGAAHIKGPFAVAHQGHPRVWHVNQPVASGGPEDDEMGNPSESGHHAWQLPWDASITWTESMKEADAMWKREGQPKCGKA